MRNIKRRNDKNIILLIESIIPKNSSRLYIPTLSMNNKNKYKIDKMIKGYFISNPPSMQDYDLVDLLSRMDILSERKEKEIVNLEKDNDMEISYYDAGDEIHITIISKVNSESRLTSMMAVASLLESACPDIFSVYLVEEKIIIAYPICESEKDENNVWDRIIDELLRLTLHALVTECIEDKEEFIRKYISTFIKWK